MSPRSLTALDEQIIALETVRDEKTAASVVAAEVTPAEEQQIEAALAALHPVIQRTEDFEAILALGTALLGAVSTVAAAGRRGVETTS